MAVRLERVTRTYQTGRIGIPALYEVSGTFPATGVHVVTGPSGSGKSTLLRLLAGLDRPDAGRIVVLGNDLESMSEAGLADLRSQAVAVVEQARGLVPFLSVRENVALAVRVRREARRPRTTDGGADHEVDIDAVLDRIGLLPRAASRPADLSSGERARVAVARALVGSPRLLLVDEPTAALDRASAREVATLLGELGAERCVIVATHDPAIIEVAATRLDLAARV